LGKSRRRENPAPASDKRQQNGDPDDHDRFHLAASGKLHRDGLSAAFWYLIVFPFKRLCHGAWNLQSYSGLRNS
jgi:hypothetical protein